MSEQKTAAELRAELEAAQARLLELRDTKSRLEQQQKMVEDEIFELAGFGYRHNRGKIGDLTDRLAEACGGIIHPDDLARIKREGK